MKIGDKVTLSPETIQYFQDTPDEGWVDEEEEELFIKGRVFTITNRWVNGCYEIDNGVGGSWESESLRIYHTIHLDDNLFEV